MILGEVEANMPWGVLLITDEESNAPVPSWDSDEEAVTGNESALVVRVLHEHEGSVQVRVWKASSRNQLVPLYNGNIHIVSGVLQVSDALGEQAVRVPVDPGEHRIRIDTDSAAEASSIDIVIDSDED